MPNLILRTERFSMSERLVDIPVSRKLREEIKNLKKEKTYQEFLVDLIKNEDRMPNDPRYTKHARPRKEMNAT